VIFEVVERLRPRVVLEIGSETGTFSERLLSYCETNAAKLVTIDRYDNALVRRLEQNRLELYLKVIELQDRLSQKAAAE
jgi:SAM-dependent MidA family methyltransferase